MDNCTVPSGTNLTLLPGVVVQFAPGFFSITVSGMIQAVGNPTNRIVFEPYPSSPAWNTISVNGTAGTNRFKYCDFQNANTAPAFNYNSTNEVVFSSLQNVTNGIQMNATAGTQTTTILNCVFSNCTGQAIYGVSYVQVGGGFYNYWAANVTLNASIKNCVFNNSGSGCVLNVAGQAYAGCCGTAIGYGYGNLQVLNNVFNNVTNTAIWLSVGSYAGGGPAALINNTFVNCRAGESATDPWDPNRKAGFVLARQIVGRVRRPGGAWVTVRLWTSLLDASTCPAAELLALYAWRWDIEVFTKELKVDLRGGTTVLQSHTLVTAAQEILALVLAMAMLSQVRAWRRRQRVQWCH